MTATETDAPELTSVRRRHIQFPRLGEGMIGSVILGGLALAFTIIPMVSTTSSSDIDADPLSPPSRQYLFGTDQLGRDLFVRTFEAGRIDLGLVVVSIAVAMIGGSIIGLIGAYLPTPGRLVVTRMTDAAMAFPYIVLVIGLAAALGTKQLLPGLPRGAAGIGIAIVIACWPPYARLTMTRALVLRSRESIIAAKVLGYSPARIIFRHIGPALVSMNLLYAATQAVATTALVGSLAFLGVGIAPPTPELGQMMADSVALLPVAWWASIIPGAAVLLIGLGFALVADATGERTHR